jgi:hypothetical protein
MVRVEMVEKRRVGVSLRLENGTRIRVLVWGFNRDGVCGLNGVDWERCWVIVGGTL